MFAVIFDVNPQAGQQEAYLAHAARLRPELERVKGFISVERFASRRRPDWLLSFSLWRDEKSLIRWRTLPDHHVVQELGRRQVFADYHLRVGEIMFDSALPPGDMPPQQRFDTTEATEAKLVGLSEGRIEGLPAAPDAARIAAQLEGFDPAAHPGLIAWDAFESLTDPGRFLLLTSWRDLEPVLPPRPDVRRRGLRIIRDYGMHARAEAPQFFPPVAAG